MNLLRFSTLALALVTTLGTSACHCGDEQHAVTISTGLDSLTVTGSGIAKRVASVGRLTQPPTSSSTLDFVFNTLEGTTGGDGIVLTIGGYEPNTPNDIVILSLAVPASLRSGAQYTVGRTFSIDASIDGDPRSIGAYDLQRSDQAEVAFTDATYSFPPPVFTTNFRAVQATGTVRVVERETGRVRLSFNLAVTDAAGRTRSVVGSLLASNERFYPPCN